MSFPRRVIAASTAAALSTIGMAQVSVTIPDGYATIEGAGVSDAVVDNGFRRTQSIYESAVVPRSLTSVGRLWLRADGQSQNLFPASQRRLTVRMSARGVPSPESASRGSFAANHGADLTTVLADRVVLFPARSPGGAPAPFTALMPLDVPFTIPAQDHVLVEIEAADEPTKPDPWPWFVDAEAWIGGWTVAPSSFGSSCGAGTSSFVAGFDRQAQVISTTYRFQRLGAAPLPGLVWFGSSDTTWGSVSLPLSLAILGAPSCSLYTDPAVGFHRMTVSNGADEEIVVTVPVPNSLSLLGQSIFSQSGVFDPAAGNPGGLRTSAGARFDFIAAPPPQQGVTLVRSGTPGDVPTEVREDTSVVLGME